MVEHVVHQRIIISDGFDAAARGVEATPNLAIGIDQQRRNATCRGRFGDLREIFPRRSSRLGGRERFHQPLQALQIMRRYDLSRALAQAIACERVRVDVDPFRSTEGIGADSAKQRMVLRQRRQYQRQAEGRE